MNAVVDILDVRERQKMVQPIGGVIARQPDLSILDPIDDTYMQAIIAYYFHVLLDLVRYSHVGPPRLSLNVRCSGPVPRAQSARPEFAR